MVLEHSQVPEETSGITLVSVGPTCTISLHSHTHAPGCWGSTSGPQVSAAAALTTQPQQNTFLGCWGKVLLTLFTGVTSLSHSRLLTPYTPPRPPPPKKKSGTVFSSTEKRAGTSRSYPQQKVSFGKHGRGKHGPVGRALQAAFLGRKWIRGVL